jgi:hypothetical protein
MVLIHSFVRWMESLMESSLTSSRSLRSREDMVAKERDLESKVENPLILYCGRRTGPYATVGSAVAQAVAPQGTTKGCKKQSSDRVNQYATITIWTRPNVSALASSEAPSMAPRCGWLEGRGLLAVTRAKMLERD